MSTRALACAAASLALLSACNRPTPAWPLVTVSDVTASTDLVDFGAVALDTTATSAVVVVNGGSSSIDLGVALDASGSPGFEVYSNPSVTVGPGTEVSIELGYAPLDYSAAQSALVLTWADATGSATVSLQATTDPDSDGDGHATSDPLVGGDDCDDGNPAAYGGAPESCYDGVDQDCDAVGAARDEDDFDCDGDGHDAVAEGGDDCDDADALAFPGAPEISQDGIDQDCDQQKDEDDVHGGELVISEVKPGSGGWIEVCNVSALTIPVDHYSLSDRAGRSTLGAATVAPGACLAICATSASSCGLVADVNVDDAGDTIRLETAEVVLDEVTTDGFGWESGAGRVSSLRSANLAANANDVASAWCYTSRGSQGVLNDDADCQ